ncbi:hypothetical protein IWX47DRAFT_851708 [Phyllosticta citricarpa]
MWGRWPVRCSVCGALLARYEGDPSSVAWIVGAGGLCVEAMGGCGGRRGDEVVGGRGREALVVSLCARRVSVS